MTFDDAIAMRPVLVGYAYRLTGNAADAEDLAQATLLRAWRAFDRLDANYPEQLTAWLKRILHNLYVDPFLHPKSVRMVQLPVAFAPEPFPCAGEHGCELAEFYDALPLLTPEHQATLLMARAGYTYPQIAVATGVAEGTVKSRVNRAEAALRRALLEPKRTHQASLRTRNQQRVNPATPALDGQAAAGALGVEV